MLLLVGPPDLSIAKDNCPSSPAGFNPPPDRVPPMLTDVIWSNVGVWLPICALLERRQLKKLLNSLSPPRNRFPFVSTSRVPMSVSCGTAMLACQVAPPSVERLNWPPPLQVVVSQFWYWK